MVTWGAARGGTYTDGSRTSLRRPTPTRLVVKAHRLVYHSTLGLRVIKKKKKEANLGSAEEADSLSLAGGQASCIKSAEAYPSRTGSYTLLSLSLGSRTF